MWNNINYLLKMSSDLDYIDHYRAITEWLGFSIVRNPFIIPYPMDEYHKESKILDISSIDLELMDYKPPLSSSSKVRAKLTGSRLSIKSPTEIHHSQNMMRPFSPHGEDKITNNNNNNKSLNDTLNQSMELNNDPMSMIRHAESIILYEEKRYGRLDRDPSGRIVPFDQVIYNSHYLKEIY